MSDYVVKQARLATVDWDNTEKVHDWRNYVGERTRALWGELDDKTKIAIAEDANDMASNEDWD